MNDHLGMFLDAGVNLADHWPDIATDTLFAIVCWLAKRDISAMDKRHERAENKFEEQGKQLNDHETRISVIERTRRSGED